MSAQHAPHGQCHHCCTHAAPEPPPREPFRFTDTPLSQWIVGGIITLAVVVALVIRST